MYFHLLTCGGMMLKAGKECRAASNFSSLSAIVAALSSTVISRLHFTWLNSSREPTLAPLLKINSPRNHYSYYRSMLDTVASTDAACTPYAGPFLKMMAAVHDQHADHHRQTAENLAGPRKSL